MHYGKSTTLDLTPQTPLLTVQPVRFLKSPKVQVDRGTVFLRSVVTVTTDLGETFYPDALELIATLRAPAEDGDIFLRRRIQWPAGARAVPIALDISRQDVDWPACVHVSVKGSAGGGFLPAFVDVWSGTVNPVKGSFDSGSRVERRFVSAADRPLRLLEDVGDSIARHLWDGSQALAQHIDDTISLQTPPGAALLPLLEYVLVTATYRRLTVLELGCGCGAVGISLAQAIPDCDVLLTDLPDVRDLIEANLARMRPAMAARARFAPLDWFAPLPDDLLRGSNPLDLIIVAECTYNTDSLGALVRTLVNLIARSPRAVIVVATKTRHASEAEFFTLMKHAGLIDEGHMRLPLPGVPGTGYADTATDVGLHVFRGKDHRLSLTPRSASDEAVPRAAAEGGDERTASR